MNQYENTIEWGAVTAGSSAVGKVIGKVSGSAVQPVVWIAKAKKPDAISVGLYLLSLGSRMASIPAAATGLLKAMADDHTLKLLTEVRRDEPAELADCICPTLDYSSFAGARINAMTIASKGGTAWRHPNGLWLYLVNPQTEDLYLYSPCAWSDVYSPVLPLKQVRGGYRWTARRR